LQPKGYGTTTPNCIKFTMTSLVNISAEAFRYTILQHYYTVYMQYMPNYRNYLYLKPTQKAIIWKELDLYDLELPILVGWIMEDNWNFLTTHRLISYKNEMQESNLAEILRIDFDTPLFAIDDMIREFIITMPEQKITVIDVPNTTTFEMLGFWNLLFLARKLAQKYQIDKKFELRTPAEKTAIWNLQV
jgi:hypothetical protein